MVALTNLAMGLAATGAINTVLAHKEDHTKIKREEIARTVQARNYWADVGKRSVGKCQNDLKHRELMDRSAARRAEKVRQLKEKRSIEAKSRKFRRDLATLESFETVNHNMTGQLDYSSATGETTVFAANTSCITTPEITDGPYYVWGELIRQDVKEEGYSDGIDLYLEVQWVDIETCDPVPGILVDIWNCNATGVYSGVESGQGGLNTTFLRGIQQTDEDGVSSFETIFPGHYEGRATHTHLLAHTNATILSNHTLAKDSGSVPHIGQLFWEESLREAVELTSPYSSNTVTVTTNDEDMWAPIQAGNGSATYNAYDPFPEYVYLGDDIEDGLFAWIQIGVNTTANQVDASSGYYSVAAYYAAGGGYENLDATISKNKM